MWPGRVSNQRPLDLQSDLLPNTNTEYRIETKTLYARLQHSFYTIRNETKPKLTNIEVLFASICWYRQQITPEAVNSIMCHIKKRSLTNIN